MARGLDHIRAIRKSERHVQEEQNQADEPLGAENGTGQRQTDHMKTIVRRIAPAHENSFLVIVIGPSARKSREYLSPLFEEDAVLRFRNWHAGHHLLLIVAGVRAVVVGADERRVISRAGGGVAE